MSLPFKPSYLNSLITGNLPKETVFRVLLEEKMFVPTDMHEDNPVMPWVKKHYVYVVVPYRFDPILETRKELHNVLNKDDKPNIILNDELRKKQLAQKELFEQWNNYDEALKRPIKYWMYCPA